MRLQGKIALVTGGSRGIGQATAVALAREGARVAVNYNSTPQGAEEALERIREAGGEAEAFQADMGERDQIEKLFAQTVARFGRIDVYVNNANAGDRRRDVGRHAAPEGDLHLGALVVDVVALAAFARKSADVDEARRDRVDADAVRGELERLAAGQAADRGLHRAVDRVGRPGPVLVD